MNAVHIQGVIGIVLAVGLGLLLQTGYSSGGPITTYVFIGYVARAAVRGDVRRW